MGGGPWGLKHLGKQSVRTQEKWSTQNSCQPASSTVALVLYCPTEKANYSTPSFFKFNLQNIKALKLRTDLEVEYLYFQSTCQLGKALSAVPSTVRQLTKCPGTLGSQYQ